MEAAEDTGGVVDMEAEAETEVVIAPIPGPRVLAALCCMQGAKARVNVSDHSTSFQSPGTPRRPPRMSKNLPSPATPDALRARARIARGNEPTTAGLREDADMRLHIGVPR